MQLHKQWRHVLLTSVTIAGILASHAVKVNAAENAPSEETDAEQTELVNTAKAEETTATEETPVDVPDSESDAPAETSEETSTVEVAEDQEIAVETDSIAQHLSVKDGHLKTDYFENKESGDRVDIEEDSDEFTFQFYPEKAADEDKVAEATAPLLAERAKYEGSEDRKDWHITSSSHAGGQGIEQAFDGDLTTIWHSNYGDGEGPVQELPEDVTIEFDQPKDVRSLAYFSRQDPEDLVHDFNGVNGTVRDYEVATKQQGAEDFATIKKGRLRNTKRAQVIDLGEQKNVTALRFTIKSDVNSQPFASAAEFDVSDRPAAEWEEELVRHYYDIDQEIDETARQVAGFDTKTTADLTVAKDGVEQHTDGDVTRTIIRFNPIDINGTSVELRYNFLANQKKNYLQRFLELKALDGDPANVRIDSIDLMNYKIPADTKEWHLPPQENIHEMAEFNGYYAGLGQPVYVSSFFTGSEFPATENTVSPDHTVYSRYFSGKTLDQLKTNEDGYVQTWNTVLGAAPSDQFDIVQKAFYDYIEDIGTPTRFRKQYNSWFDHMTDINSENILESFRQIERQFTANGVAPIDSYVVDDGWEDLHTLWDFNEKFPNKLYGPSKQVKRLGGDFGLWLGPQGGYAEPETLADALTEQNLGSKYNGVNYVADKRYTEGLRDLFSRYNKEFDINYWKLDGLLLKPRPDTDPNGNFIGGGFKNMYSMTESQERWIELFQTIRDTATDPDKIWINLTSYNMPSAWFLQWVDSVWMQDSTDIGFEDGIKDANHHDLDFGNDANETVSYRDTRYEEFVNKRQWQLPFSRFYNHDPIYGNKANSLKVLDSSVPEDEREPRPTIHFSTEDMRNYLYFLATRGAGFFEYYFSYNLITPEQWQVIGEATNWIEDNYGTLQHAKYHGGEPGEGEVYGYADWNDKDGIISVRNPIQTKQKYTLHLDETVGVLPDAKNLYRKTVVGDKTKYDTAETFGYGDDLTFELEPWETVILQFSGQKDERPAEVYYGQVPNNREIQVTFDERVAVDDAKFYVNGEEAKATLAPNYRTVIVTPKTPLKADSVAHVTYENVYDNAGDPNAASGKLDLTYHQNQRTLALPKAALNHTAPAERSINGRTPFTVSAKVTLDELGGTIAKQGDEWALTVTPEGRIQFQVGDTTVTSAPFTKLKAADKDEPDKLLKAGDTVAISAVRNPNGSLRLFLDGETINTGYNKDDVNRVLSAAPITFGTDGFAGTIANFALETFARDFESAPKVANETIETPSVELTATDKADAGHEANTPDSDSSHGDHEQGSGQAIEDSEETEESEETTTDSAHEHSAHAAETATTEPKQAKAQTKGLPQTGIALAGLQLGLALTGIGAALALKKRK